MANERIRIEFDESVDGSPDLAVVGARLAFAFSSRRFDGAAGLGVGMVWRCRPDACAATLAYASAVSIQRDGRQLSNGAMLKDRTWARPGDSVWVTYWTKERAVVARCVGVVDDG
jgi:hypothetical protein